MENLFLETCWKKQTREVHQVISHQIYSDQGGEQTTLNFAPENKLSWLPQSNIFCSAFDFENEYLSSIVRCRAIDQMSLSWYLLLGEADDAKPNTKSCSHFQIKENCWRRANNHLEATVQQNSFSFIRKIEILSTFKSFSGYKHNDIGNFDHCVLF